MAARTFLVCFLFPRRLIEKRPRLLRAILDPIVAHLLVCSMLALGSIPFV